MWKASGERQRFWRDLIGRQATSGLSVARFCEQAGVSPNSYFVWKRRFRSANGQIGHRSTRLGGPAEGGARRKKRSTAVKSLVPVRLVADPVSRKASSPETIEVEWPNGIVLRVPAGFDSQTLRDVLNVLTPATDARAPSC